MGVLRAVSIIYYQYYCFLMFVGLNIVNQYTFLFRRRTYFHICHLIAMCSFALTYALNFCVSWIISHGLPVLFSYQTCTSTVYTQYKGVDFDIYIYNGLLSKKIRTRGMKLSLSVLYLLSVIVNR